MNPDTSPGLSGAWLELVGLGSPHGDDQLGWIAVDRLRLCLPAGAVATKAAGGLDLLSRLSNQPEVVVVDAAAPAGRPGRRRSFTWPCDDLLETVAWSTHGLGLIEALRLADLLGKLPRRVRIETVEAHSAVPGHPLSAAAAHGLDELVETLLARFAAAQPRVREDTHNHLPGRARSGPGGR